MKDNPPVTFSIAASETQNVNVTVLPCFGLTEGSRITAKDMWTKMTQVHIWLLILLNSIGLPFFCFKKVDCISIERHQQGDTRPVK